MLPSYQPEGFSTSHMHVTGAFCAIMRKNQEKIALDTGSTLLAAFGTLGFFGLVFLFSDDWLELFRALRLIWCMRFHKKPPQWFIDEREEQKEEQKKEAQKHLEELELWYTGMYDDYLDEQLGEIRKPRTGDEAIAVAALQHHQRIVFSLEHDKEYYGADVIVGHRYQEEQLCQHSKTTIA